MILGKSNHPVEVKKIRLRVWSLRSEVEKAIATRKAECIAQGIDENYEDIEFFYNHKAGQGEVVQIGEGGDPTAPGEGSGTEELKPEVGEIDDDMLAMQAALTGGEEGAAEANAEDEKADEAKDQDPKEGDPDQAESPESSPEEQESNAEGEGQEDNQSGEGEVTDAESALLSELTNEIAAKKDDQQNDTHQNNVEDSQHESASDFKPTLPIVSLPQNSDESLEFHLTFPRSIPDEELQAACFCFLADVDMTSIRIFSTKPFTYGQAVVIDFHIPIRFQVVGEIKNCHNLNMKTRIISETKPNYRLLIKFNFKRPGERTNLRKFLKSVEPTIPSPAKKKKAKAEEELDELDF